MAAMQAAAMNAELVITDSVEIPSVDGWQLARRILFGAMIVAGVATTLFILGHLGTLAVYGLPAPFLRRIPVRADAA
jgi:hypothetical protein